MQAEEVVVLNLPAMVVQEALVEEDQVVMLLAEMV